MKYLFFSFCQSQSSEANQSQYRTRQVCNQKGDRG